MYHVITYTVARWTTWLVASQQASVEQSFVQVLPTVSLCWFSNMTNTFSEHACDICVNNTAFLAYRKRGGANKRTNLKKKKMCVTVTKHEK